MNKLRKEITDLLLRDFGYNAVKSEKRLERRFGSRSYEELTDIEKQQYDRQKKKQDAFDEWFIESERNAIRVRSVVVVRIAVVVDIGKVSSGIRDCPVKELF